MSARCVTPLHLYLEHARTDRPFFEIHHEFFDRLASPFDLQGYLSVIEIFDASEGMTQAIDSDPGLAKGVNVMNGEVTCQSVAEAHGLPFTPVL